jgi:hypothetical protein
VPLRHIRIRWTGSEAPVGPFRTTVEVDTNDPAEPTLTIPVTAFAQGDVRLAPSSLFFGRVKDGSKVSRYCDLEATSKPLDPEHLKIESDNRFVAASLQTIKAAGKSRIRLVAEFQAPKATPASTITGCLMGRQDGQVLFAVPYTALVVGAPDQSPTVSTPGPRPDNPD